MESILVTGGAGFIGSNIVDALLERNYTVVVLDDLSTGHKENISQHVGRKNFAFYQGSILDAALMRDIMRRHDISRISHQAAAASVTKSIQDPAGTSEVNVIGTIKLFDLASEYRCKRVVFASSCALYGDTRQLPITESVPVLAKSPYAAGKAADELFAGVFRSLYGEKIIGLRYFNVYGQRQDPASDYAAVIPKFITLALENRQIPIEGDGLQTRDFVYIKDIVQANIKALIKETLPGGAYNIACGRQTSILDLANKIIAVSGSQSAITQVPCRKGDVRNSQADIEKARIHLDFNPEYTIETGLRETVAWYRENMSDRGNAIKCRSNDQLFHQLPAGIIE